MRRRTVLELAAMAAAVPFPEAHVARPKTAPKTVKPRLLPSRYRDNMDRTVNYLRFVDPDRMLHMFRVTAGLPSDAEPLGGWEAPTVQLRGHSTGHLLSALAQAAYWLDDKALTAKGARIVDALARCQAPNGYLSAFPETTFDDLETGKNPWAPYYTIHKILAGLLDQFRLQGNANALRVARGIGDWADARTGRLSHDRMQAVLHVEFGGMNEALTNLAGLTGEPRYLAAARRFDHDEIFTPLAAGQDTLSGRHANTDLAKIVGAAAEYVATGDERYRDIATYFWDQVVHHHSYVIGGNANAEFFGPPDQIVSQLGENTCENCNSYNMLKLTRRLSAIDPSRLDYLDYYEWTLLNQMLGEQDPDAAHGFVTYYTGLSQSAERKGKDGLTADPGSYSSDYGNFSCDHGSGLETMTKFAEPVYDVEGGDTLRVNLFVPSEVDFGGTTVRLTTAYPFDSTIRLTVPKNASFPLKVRIPGWVRNPELRVDGVRSRPRAGTFATVKRGWRNVELILPMTPQWRAAPDNPAVHALTYGPLVYAGRYGDTPPKVLPTLDPNGLRPVKGTRDFTAGALTLSPFLDVHHEHYNVYFALPPARRRDTVIADYRLDGKDDDVVLAGGAIPGERGIELNGTGAHVVLPEGLPAGLTHLTIGAWARLNTIANSARVFDLGFNTQSYMFLTPRTGNGTARFAMKLGGMETEDFVDAAVALPIGVWTHVEVRVADTLRFYVDGELSGENPSPLMGAILLGATQFNYLGRSQNPKHPYLDGAIADFRLTGGAR